MHGLAPVSFGATSSSSDDDDEEEELVDFFSAALEVGFGTEKLVD
jgi:hypothetical protein